MQNNWFICLLNTKNVNFVCVVQSECEQKGESYWYSVTASAVTRIVENIEVIFPPNTMPVDKCK